MSKLGLWLPGVVVAAVFAVGSTALAAGWLQHGHRPGERSQAADHVVVVSGAVRAPRTASPVTPPSSTSAGQAVTNGAFSLTVRTTRGEIEAAVAPLRATLRSDGAAEPIDPPHGNARQWDTAAWIEQSAYPASPATGPSYVYGHACHYHVCPFSRLTDVAVGDTVTVRTAPRPLTYRVCARGLSPKSVNLVVPACTGANADLVLVTCQYESGDTSVDNLVVVATLIAGSAGAP